MIRHDSNNHGARFVSFQDNRDYYYYNHDDQWNNNNNNMLPPLPRHKPHHQDHDPSPPIYRSPQYHTPPPPPPRPRPRPSLKPHSELDDFGRIIPPPPPPRNNNIRDDCSPNYYNEGPHYNNDIERNNNHHFNDSRSPLPPPYNNHHPRYPSHHHHDSYNKRSDSSSTRTSSSSCWSGDGSSSTRHNNSSVRTGRTSAISFKSSFHGRLRRQERHISRRQLQKAMKYGTCQPVGNGRSKYIHEGISFIVDNRTKQEITSYVSEIDLPYQTISKELQKQHQDVKTHFMKILQNKKDRYDNHNMNNHSFKENTSITSHSIIIVDSSGSMRNSDVRGSRSRFASVWYALAEDFVRQRIECGIASLTDIVTIILMGDIPTVLLEKEPTSWVLYNKILRIFKEGTIQPRGHGYYIPSLHVAEEILLQQEQQQQQQQYTTNNDRAMKDEDNDHNNNSSITTNNINKNNNNFPLVLVLLSDGRPSDSFKMKKSFLEGTEVICETVSNLGKKLGDRLTVQTIGIGNGTLDQFYALKSLCRVAIDSGCHSASKFQVPSMSGGHDNQRKPHGFGRMNTETNAAAASLGAAISSVATSLTDTQASMMMGGSRKRMVRQVEHEKKEHIPLLTEVVTKDDGFNIFMGENAVSRMIFEHDTSNATTSTNEGKFIKAPLHHPDAMGVAMKKKPFGEGTERFAYQFFEIGSDGCSVVGNALVAKESKYYTHDNYFWEDMDKFVKRFCRIQYHAQVAATAFNQRLDQIKHLESPRIQFLPCSVYYITDDTTNKEHAVIVEERLYGKFNKWNSNNGWIKRVTSTPGKQADSWRNNGFSSLPSILEQTHGVVPSRKDEEVYNIKIETIDGIKREVLNLDDDDDDDGNRNTRANEKKNTAERKLQITHNDLAQSFSHFSYIHSGRKMIVCDLQGVYNPNLNKLQFTDPVIHYYDECNQKRTRKYGITDRGEKGMDDFWKTHKCNCLCQIVTKGFF